MGWLVWSSVCGCEARVFLVLINAVLCGFRFWFWFCCFDLGVGLTACCLCLLCCLC